MICDHAVLAGINTGDERRAVYVCCARINRMVIAKSNSLTGKFPERWGVFFRYEIWTHPVPNHDHNMPPNPLLAGSSF